MKELKCEFFGGGQVGTVFAAQFADSAQLNVNSIIQNCLLFLCDVELQHSSSLKKSGLLSCWLSQTVLNVLILS